MIAQYTYYEWVQGDTTVSELKQRITENHRKIKQNSSNNQKAYHYCLKPGVPRRGVRGVKPNNSNAEILWWGDELPFQ